MVPGGSHIDMVYIYVPAFWGAFFAKFGIASGGFSSEKKEPKLHKLGVFWVNYYKKYPIWTKLGVFYQKWYIDRWGNWVKNWYGESQNFWGPADTSKYNFWESNPPRCGVEIKKLIMIVWTVIYFITWYLLWSISGDHKQYMILKDMKIIRK